MKDLRKPSDRIYSETTDQGLTDGFLDINYERELRVLRTALEQSPVTAVITSVDGTIEYVNPQFEKTSGYTAAEAIGKNARILKSEERSEAECAEMWRVIRSGASWRGTFHSRKKNGEHYWEEATISPVTNEKGEITNYLALKQDVTRQREIAKER
ncbi:MAG: PAS domain-containing protein, partial [Alkalispirochaeta sp.]